MANFGQALGIYSGRNLLYCTKVEETQEADTEDATYLWNTTAKEYFTGVTTNALALEGWYTDSSTTDNNAYDAQFGAADGKLLLMYGVPSVSGTAVFGNPCMIWDGCRLRNYKRMVETRAFTKYSVEAVGDAMPQTGKTLHPAFVESSFPYTSYPSNDVNFGASGTGGVAQLHVVTLTLGSATAITVALYDSADGTSFTIVSGGTFTNVSAAPASQTLTISGTIRQYVGINITGVGGTPTSTMLAVGLKKN